MCKGYGGCQKEAGGIELGASGRESNAGCSLHLCELTCHDLKEKKEQNTRREPWSFLFFSSCELTVNIGNSEKEKKAGKDIFFFNYTKIDFFFKFKVKLMLLLLHFNPPKWYFRTYFITDVSFPSLTRLSD